MYFFTYCELMSKSRLLKLGFNKEDIKYVAYTFLPDHRFNYREIINSKKRYGVPNIEVSESSYTYGILYHINDDMFYKIIHNKCKPSKYDGKYKYLIKNVLVEDCNNFNKSWKASTIFIHPLRSGDEKYPDPKAHKYLLKTVNKIPSHAIEHCNCIEHSIH